MVWDHEAGGSSLPTPTKLASRTKPLQSDDGTASWQSQCFCLEECVGQTDCRETAVTYLFSIISAA